MVYDKTCAKKSPIMCQASKFKKNSIDFVQHSLNDFTPPSLKAYNEDIKT